MKKWKFLSGVLELVLAVPILGFLLSWVFIPWLQIGLIALHIFIINKTDRMNNSIMGNVTGIIANVFSIVPVFGIALRLIAGIVITSECPKIIEQNR